MTHTWLDKTEYPFASHYFTINDHRLHYIDEGEGDVILFVHGTPSWSFDFRNMVNAFRSTHRCIAIDHIGFGLSDKPRLYDYSTINHSKTLEEFMISKDLTNITLVVHDFGGPIGLHAAMRHPHRIKKILVLNSWMWSSEGEPAFMKLRRILKSPLLPWLYRYLNFSPRFIMPSSFGAHKLTLTLGKQYTSPFTHPGDREGPLAFAYSLLNDQSLFEQLWNNRHHIHDKPVLLIWGMRDPVITPSYLEKFISGFSNTHVVRLDTCGHFPQEEQPEEVIRAMTLFNLTMK